MKRLKVIHQTSYQFSDSVQLQPHGLRLRPREGHDQHIESSRLTINPPASLRWHRDAEGNSVAIASFDTATNHLSIESETVVQQFDVAPQDCLVADYAVNYPFNYLEEDRASLSCYMANATSPGCASVGNWVGEGEDTQGMPIFSLLLQLNQRIYQGIAYRVREEEGVQSPQQTLEYGTGSCRDMAGLFMSAARRLGFAARFVSGYIYTNDIVVQSGSTHAWAEVFIPGAGWKGFDPTFGTLVGVEHIAVAVAREPQSIPPIAGSFYGTPFSSMSVNVWVLDVG
ncbi:transglutaminase family protein [Aliiglaciecola sp. CAU 1673]|uniref:transglutaminase family protein n=1 Tax=Aliiglaciecola sp. CAU 1673 TaxID=3032595 RepID=UPI0023DC9F8C|nr:transglutaminase family protein [Aliiglaciecola sp. CAU 1673]MDF2177003.1 transglutaminase family protein [Aliiglaciecola sp. CAU 1673]